MKIAVVAKRPIALTETFIRGQVEKLPGATVLLHGQPPLINNESRTPLLRGTDFLLRVVQRLEGSGSQVRMTRHYKLLLYRLKPDVVLAQFGPSGVAVREACGALRIPLVVYFRGYDASRHSVLEKNKCEYPALFQSARATISVSRFIRDRIIDLGADPASAFVNPSGADVERFSPPAEYPGNKVALAVGRFTEKKAPYLTIMAFARVLEREPEARLRMIGDGELMEACAAIAKALGISHAVEFMGAQSHDVVSGAIKEASIFVQHSMQAPSGDCEGAPVAIMEAGASGVPVVATRHAGIPEIISEGETGLLVNEGDVDGMARHILYLLKHPDLAAEMGRKARGRICRYFSQQDSAERTFRILQWASGERSEKPPLVPARERTEEGVQPVDTLLLR